jgi:hypothetical protein
MHESASFWRMRARIPKHQARLPKPYNVEASPVGANGRIYLATALIMAAFYNLIAGAVGGIEIDIEQV